MNEQAFLQQIIDDPANAATTWLVLADWLEERGDPRAELVRLIHDPNFRPKLFPVQRYKRVRKLVTSGVPPCLPMFTNSIGMRFVQIPAGKFLMGSPSSEERRDMDEGPQHEVKITRSFCLGVYPVTQQEYEKVIGDNPSHFSADGDGRDDVRGLDTSDFPVDSVSWNRAVGFCGKLSSLLDEKQQEWTYRLPTEAEWEYACRGGPFLKVSAPFYFKVPAFTLDTSKANFNGFYGSGEIAERCYLRRTAAVASYEPNALGLYDLHGNVWEWCQDWFGDYPAGRVNDPKGPEFGVHRVLRGGAWCNYGRECRAAFRATNVEPATHNASFGLRVVCHLAASDSDKRSSPD